MSALSTRAGIAIHPGTTGSLALSVTLVLLLAPGARAQTGRQVVDQAQARNGFSTWRDRKSVVTLEGFDGEASRVTREAQVYERSDPRGEHRTLMEDAHPVDHHREGGRVRFRARRRPVHDRPSLRGALTRRSPHRLAGLFRGSSVGFTKMTWKGPMPCTWTIPSPFLATQPKCGIFAGSMRDRKSDV